MNPARGSYLPAAAPKRNTAMGPHAFTGAAGSNLLLIEKRCIDVGKILQAQSGNLGPDKAFNRAHVINFFRGAKSESIANLQGSSGPANSMNVIFRMLRDIVVNH